MGADGDTEGSQEGVDQSGGSVDGGASTVGSGTDAASSDAEADSESGTDTGSESATDSADATLDGSTGEESGGPAACIVHVAPGGNDQSSGASWDEAKASLNAALDAAELGEVPCDVWVAAGSYLPTEDGDRDVSIELRPGIAVYGGFAGDETLLEERDWTANVTIFSGDLGVLDDHTDNSRHVVVAAAGARLDGVTISGGFSDGVGDDRHGAGIRSTFVDFTLAHARVVGNRSGDGLADEGGASGGTGGSGAGVYVQGGSVSIVDVVFSQNVGGRGGMGPTNGGTGGSGAGLYVLNATNVELRGCSFIDNQTGQGGNGGSIAGSGGSSGGAHIIGNDSTVEVVDCLFEGNVTGGNGDVGTFNNQRGAFGGLFFSENGSSGSFQLVNCEFVGNAAETGAGATIYLLAAPDATALVANCLFRDNEGQGASGGLQVSTDGTGDLSIVNSTFVGNTAPVGSAIAFGGAPSQGDGTISVLNSIIWDNPFEFTGPIVAAWSPSVDTTAVFVDHTDVEGGCVENMNSAVVCGTGNQDVDPLFESGSDFHLQPGSPLVDAGDESYLPQDAVDLDDDGDLAELLSLDLDGFARLAGFSVDLGVYEELR